MTSILSDDFHTLAALDALDLLDGAERYSFESALEQGGDAMALLARYQRTAVDLLELVSPKAPPASVRERLLARLPGGAGDKASPPDEFALGPGILLVRGQKKPWEETGIPGIRRKILHYDPERNYASNLVSMAAGSVYPSHSHADLEELYMLSGQILLSGHTLGVGDYCRSEPGTVHDEAVAASDCLFIAFASVKNEFRRPPAARMRKG